MESSGRSRIPARQAAGVAISVAGVSNVVTNRWLPASLYVPWNLGMAGALLLIARSSGSTALDLGLGRRHLLGSLQAGALGAGIVASGYGLALLSPLESDFFRDERVTVLPRTTSLWHVMVRIPLGTVLAEEVTFRGVLPALLAASRGPAWLPGAVSSLLFGLWHVLPSLELARANAAMRRLVHARATGASVLSVGMSTVAGFVLHLLRRRTGHVAAPVLTHLAANTVGFVIARLSQRHARD
jgi:membrane protease YdiL (CAAX protease family)